MGGMEDDDEESEDELSEEDDAQHLVNMAKVTSADKKKPANGQSLKKGGDLDKALKAATKNTMKNSMELASESEDDEDLDDDEF